jgi:uncharacterized protein
VSQANVDAFLRGNEAGNRGDHEAALELISEDVVFLPARSAMEGGFRGHDGMRRFWADNAENFELFEVEFQELRDLGDRVLAIGTVHIRGRGGGVETDIPTAGVATFEDGKMTRWEDFRERALALEAVGLRE